MLVYTDLKWTKYFGVRLASSVCLSIREHNQNVRFVFTIATSISKQLLGGHFQSSIGACPFSRVGDLHDTLLKFHNLVVFCVCKVEL